MRFTLAGCTLLLVLLAGAARPAAGADLTAAYEAAWGSECGFGRAREALLRRHKVLLVSGYFGDIDPQYFSDHIRWLDALRVEHERVPVKARDSTAVNGPIVAGAIRASTKPVILLTHSKGSVDALEALRAEPPLRARVRAWISLQGAFLGSPVADALLDGSLLDPVLAIAILQFFGGTREAAEGLRTGVSRGYVRRHADAIGAVLRDVPAIAFASTVEGPSGVAKRTVLEFPREIMARQGIASDGLIPAESAVLPGMDYVRVAGVDHIAPVMPAMEPFDRVRMTNALLTAMRGPFRALPRAPGCER